MGLVNLIGRVGTSSATEWLPVTEQKYMGVHIAYRLYPLTSNGVIVHPGCPTNNLGNTVFYNSKFQGTPQFFARVERSSGVTSYSDYASGSCVWETNYADNSTLLGNVSLYGSQTVITPSDATSPLKCIESTNYPSGTQPILTAGNPVFILTSSEFAQEQGHTHDAPQGVLLAGPLDKLDFGGGVLVCSSCELSAAYVEIKYSVWPVDGFLFEAPARTYTGLKLAWQDTDRGLYYYYAELGDRVYFSPNARNVYVAFPSIYFATPSVYVVGDYVVTILDNFLVFR